MQGYISIIYSAYRNYVTNVQRQFGLILRDIFVYRLNTPGSFLLLLLLLREVLAVLVAMTPENIGGLCLAANCVTGLKCYCFFLFEKLNFLFVCKFFG